MRECVHAQYAGGVVTLVVCWHGYGCHGKWFEHSGTCVAEGGKAALMLPSVVLSWSRS